MLTPNLAAIDWVNGSLVVVFILVSLAMILAVLVQRPSGGGLAGAFGSAAGSGQTAFGARTGDALTIFTITIFILFIVIAGTLNHTIRPSKATAAPSISAPVGGATSSGAPASEPAPQAPTTTTAPETAQETGAADDPAPSTPAGTEPAPATPEQQPPASPEPAPQPAPGAAPSNP